MTTTLRTQENCTNKNDDKNVMCRPPMCETHLYHLSNRMLECHSCLHSTPFLACFMLNPKCDDLRTAKSTPLHGLKKFTNHLVPWHGRGRGRPYLFSDDLYVDDGRFIDSTFPPLESSLGEAKAGRLFITQVRQRDLWWTIEKWNTYSYILQLLIMAHTHIPYAYIYIYFLHLSIYLSTYLPIYLYPPPFNPGIFGGGKA